MAELINKGVLGEEIESLTVHVTGLRAGKGVLSKFMDEYRKSVLRIIDEQPTTTEAEIRNRAIDEVLETLSKYDDVLSVIPTADLQGIICVIEQLKERE